MVLYYKRKFAGYAGRRVRRRIATRTVARFGARRAALGLGYAGAAAMAGYGVYKGVRRLRRARARRIQRRKIGMRMGYRPKTTATSLNPTMFSTNTLNRSYLDDIAEGEQPNQRQYNAVNIKGFRMNAVWRNETNHVLRVCCAIISPKTAGNLENPNINTYFFRSYGNSRQRDFPDPGTGLTYDQWVNSPINADRYIVLHRWDFTLNPKDGTDRQITGNSIKALKRYIPIKRRIAYPNESNDTPVEGRIMFCWWAVRMLATNTQAAETDSVGHSHQFVTYFSDTK